MMTSPATIIEPKRYADMRQTLINERKRKGWSQAKLALQLGAGSVTVGSWERGDRTPSMPMFTRWCEALGLEPQLAPLGSLPSVDSVRVMVMVDHVRAAYAEAITMLGALLVPPNALLETADTDDELYRTLLAFDGAAQTGVTRELAPADGG